jgi:hypothetical protein
MGLRGVAVPREIPSVCDVDWYDDHCLLLSVAHQGLVKFDLSSGSWESSWAMPVQ